MEFNFHFFGCPRWEALVQISKKEEYGLRLVTRLAADGGRLSIRELADLEGLPETTVAKVISRLRRAGLVVAERGRNGGYSLKDDASRITVGRVVATFGGTIYGPEFCDRMTPGDRGCTHLSDCGLKPLWHGLRTVVGDFLDSITVADVMNGSARRDGQLPVATGHGP
jgi:Rrf2 family protein